jgi:hypothetical protein
VKSRAKSTATKHAKKRGETNGPPTLIDKLRMLKSAIDDSADQLSRHGRYIGAYGAMLGALIPDVRKASKGDAS